MYQAISISKHHHPQPLAPSCQQRVVRTPVTEEERLHVLIYVGVGMVFVGLAITFVGELLTCYMRIFNFTARYRGERVQVNTPATGGTWPGDSWGGACPCQVLHHHHHDTSHGDCHDVTGSCSARCRGVWMRDSYETLRRQRLGKM